MMLKAWQPRIGVWLNRELSLFLQDDTVKYTIGPTGDHCAVDAVKTEVATAGSETDTSIVIDATTDFGDTFDADGILESDDASAWTALGGTLTLDGVLVSGGIATLSSERLICITSDADESGITLTVSGEDAAGATVTETITGPNTTTVYSTETFLTVTSITYSAAGNGNVTIGQVGNHVGVELDDGTVQWTYIAAALSTTLSLAAALTDDVAVDNHVYSYTRKCERPIEIVEARLARPDGYETPLKVGGRHDYMMLSNKTSEGTVNQIYYDKQLDNGYIHVWPEPSDVQYYIKMTARYPIMDVDELEDDFEVAQEWFEAIAWNLAVRLFPKYAKPIDPGVKMMADEMLANAMASDTDNADIRFQISMRRHG
jgi:hypothetical protein